MAGGTALKTNLTFDEAWRILQEEAINKLIDSLEIEGLPPNHGYFTSEEYMRLYTVVYNLCASGGPVNPQSDRLYGQYKGAFEDYISSKILPSLNGKQDEDLLREFLRRWNNHKTMTRWLSRFFHYLSRYYIPIKRLPSLVQASCLTFYDRVYGEIKVHVIDAIISLINLEREDELIDRVLVKRVLDILKEIGEGALKNYGENIGYVVKATEESGSRDYKDFMRVIKECFENEKTVVSECLRLSNKDEVLEVYGEIKDRVCDAILSLERNNQIEGKTSRIYRVGRDEGIDQVIMKQVRRIFEDMSDDASKFFAKDIEEALVGATAIFYSKKASEWIATESYDDYMLKVEECLEKEKSRFADCLRLKNKNKALEAMRHEMLDLYADKLEEKRVS